MLATTSTWAIRVNFDNKTMCIRLKKKKFICNRMKNE